MPNLTEAEKRQRYIARHFKQMANSGAYKESNFGRTNSGRVPKNKRKPKQSHLAAFNHYQDYLALKPKGPSSSGGKTHPLGPDLIFLIRMNSMFYATLNSGDKKLKEILYKIQKEFRILYKRVITHLKVELIGDYRKFAGGSKGLIPRGGTGYARMLTRSFIEAQDKFNMIFPFSVNISVPVKYASYLNQLSTASLKHDSSGYRIVDYRSGKAKYKKIKLYDPEAVQGFYETIIELERNYVGSQVSRLIRRLAVVYNPILLNYSDPYGNILEVDRDMFMFGPPEFAKVVT